MTDEQLTRILFNGAVLALIGAFWPLIMKLLRRLGYRSMKEQRELDEKK